MTLGAWQATWHRSGRVDPLTEGERGDGSRRGEVGVATFPAGEYPSCSRHGALMALSATGVWRCMAHGCNAGAQTTWPWVAT